MRYIIFTMTFLFALSLNAQKDYKSNPNSKYKEYRSIYNAQVECLGVGSSGVYSLKVGVSQRKKKVDYDKAKRAAVFSVIFNGVPGGSNGCYSQDPILEPDAFEENFAYFKDFFDTGKFMQFVSLSNEEYTQSIKMKKGWKLRMDVIINYEQLTQKLKKDGLYKGLDSFF